MATLKNKTTGDVIHVFGAVAEYYESRPEWERISEQEVKAEVSGDLEDYTVVQLREMASANDVAIGRNDSKADIIKKIEEN